MRGHPGRAGFPWRRRRRGLGMIAGSLVRRPDAMVAVLAMTHPLAFAVLADAEGADCFPARATAGLFTLVYVRSVASFAVADAGPGQRLHRLILFLTLRSPTTPACNATVVVFASTS